MVTERWHTLIDSGQPVLADGAMGTSLFAEGLQFGDPPEVWNLTHPDVVRRIQQQPTNKDADTPMGRQSLLPPVTITRIARVQ